MSMMLVLVCPAVVHVHTNILVNALCVYAIYTNTRAASGCLSTRRWGAHKFASPDSAMHTAVLNSIVTYVCVLYILYIIYYV